MRSDQYASTTTPDTLLRRARLLRATRAFFDDRHFVEVQTPVLSQDVIIDQHLDPLMVQVDVTDGRHGSLPHRFLQTSPEQNMKRLLACGMQAIYQIGPVFRAGEIGQWHNPEFTMLEWYRIGDGLEAGIQLLGELMEHLLQTPTPDRMTFSQAFVQSLAIDPLDCRSENLSRLAIEHGLVDSARWSEDKDDWLDLLFSHLIQPSLGHSTPVVVTHFPVSQAALALTSTEDRRTAERFEIFYQGIELANGYHELLDPHVLRERNHQANSKRVASGKLALPEENRLLDAMEAGIPACCGCALGLDRVVAIACSVRSLQEVICFPWDRA